MGILLIWPEVPTKPVLDLKVEDAEDREMTEEEILEVTTYNAKKGNFETVQTSVEGTMTGKYRQVIDNVGPIWIKDEVRYTIAHIFDPKRVKQEIEPSGTCIVIDTGKLGGAEWLKKNGYIQELRPPLVAVLKEM